MTNEEKVTPHDQDTEKAYVSNCLQHLACLDDAIELGAEKWVFDDGNKAILDAAFSLRDQNEPVDVTSVGSKMVEQGTAEKWLPELVTVFGHSATMAHHSHYGKVIRGQWVKRQIIKTLETNLESAYEDETVGDDLINEVETEVLSIRETCEMKDGSLVSGKDAVMKLLENIEKAQVGGGGLAGHPTGIVQLDAMTSGFQGGNLVLLPARPSTGKTACLITILMGLLEIDVPCACFTLEMQTKEIMRRMICMGTGIEYRKLLEGGLSQTDLANIMRVSGNIADASFIIDDTPALGLNQFRTRCRRLARNGVKVVGVDYVQLMRHYTKRSRDNRQVEIADISAGVKSTLKECNMTGIILAQLNRDVEKTARKPRLSDIRESGALEQDADIVMCIYRPNRESEDYIDLNEEPCSFEILKNRNGPTGSIPMTFHKKSMRFRERA